MKNKKSFTLIEIISVMAIIMTLAGMVLVVSKGALSRAKRSKAEAMISALSVAIGMFHADTGTYPWANTINNSYGSTLPADTNFDGPGDCAIGNLMDQLNSPSHEPISGTLPIAGWKGPYIELKTSDFSGQFMATPFKDRVIDPWGTLYYYQSINRPSAGIVLHHINSFDMSSAGPDKIFGTTDDITNW